MGTKLEKADSSDISKKNLIEVTFIQRCKHLQKFLNLNMGLYYFQPFRITAFDVCSNVNEEENTLL